MGLVTFNRGVDFKKTFSFLEAIRDKIIYRILDNYGKKGVELLRDATPKRTGKTSESWSYQITMSDGHVSLEWFNSNMGNDGITPIAILIQMGHGTRTGGYVQPNDYINPVMTPLLDELVEEMAKVVTML